MQRKRGGLVPIGEVSSLDDDTPPAIPRYAETGAPSPLPIRTSQGLSRQVPLQPPKKGQ